MTLRLGDINGIQTGQQVTVWELLAVHDTEGAAESSFAFVGLNGDVDQEYRFVARTVNGGGGTDLYLQPNADAGANYATEFATSRYTGIGGTGGLSVASLGTTGDIADIDALIHAASGQYRGSVSMFSVQPGAGSYDAGVVGAYWSNTTDNITSLVVIQRTGSNYIGVGSHFELWVKRVLTLGQQGQNPGTATVMQLVAEHDTPAGGETSFSFTGLAGDVDIEYEIRGRWMTGSGGDDGVWAQLNGDTNTAHYSRRLMQGKNTATPGSFQSSTQTGLFLAEQQDAGSGGNFRAHLFAKSGEPRYLVSVHATGDGGSNNFEELAGGAWTNTTDPITSITILCSVSGNIAAGSHFELWARRAVQVGVPVSNPVQTATIMQLIQSYTVPAGSPVSSYTFAGLNGDGDVRYILKARLLNATGDDSMVVQPNGDATGAHYLWGSMFGAAGSAGASDAAAPATGGFLGNETYTAAGDSDLQMEIYAKSGVNRFAVAHYGTFTSVPHAQLATRATVWKNTADPITSLVVTGYSGTAFMGPGTVLELWAERTVSFPIAGQNGTAIRRSFKGSGTGDYTVAATTPADVDATLLKYVVTIPVGWKLSVDIWATLDVTIGANVFLAIADGGTPIAQTEESLGQGAENFWPIAWGCDIDGDGLSHTITMQAAYTSGTGAKIRNSTVLIAPRMRCVLAPAN